jgi:ribosome-binding factor A
MTSFKRSERVADLLQVEISDILLKQIRDPRIGRVTITGVKVSDDLRLAKVYFVEMAKDTPGDDARQGLMNAAGYLKRELGKRLNLRFVPDLVFYLDKSFAYSSRIERLLKEIHAEETGDAGQDH